MTTTLINVRTATMAQLVEFFNANTGGNPVKKFADRPTAEKRVNKLVEEMEAEIGYGDKQEEDERALPTTLSGNNKGGFNIAEGSNGLTAADFGVEAEFANLADPAKDNVIKLKISEDDGTVHAFSVHGMTHCPSCGVHLSNGVGEHNQEVNGKLVKHTHFEFECLGCGVEFGPALPSVKKVAANKVGPRPAMVQSLKIDRRIVDLLTGEEYANACQVWKAGLVSAAQGDRLSAVLYGAFKKTGKRDATIAINGHTFRLAF